MRYHSLNTGAPVFFCKFIDCSQYPVQFGKFLNHV